MYHIIENNMGIHLLNRFLRTKNPKGIKEVHLNTFANKKIAIDISIYLYRYASQDALTENILKMCNLFKSHKIRPLFVFDGKSSDKKQETLLKRKEAKQKAYSQYTVLKNDNRFLKNKSRLLRELKRKSTYINIKMINQDMYKRNSTSKKKIKQQNKTRKRREELSVFASKSIKKEKIKIVVEFK